ncbi:aldehyde dehydrogenase domain-containing protein [Cokeromyces recurvatus]|uniref:aldehyde dehydrogenase domain-containing protein n=1 Tax=Cokeromyces recurvatus TaxID=90255 RepID=UPI002220F372|nr:aldehyde dehydrogenase domain-containing protein [Cokeromyces recurvatus]KAI7899885.1 aldehyde dehydrogenase domain-containing protein [Cokeromyces recurvatus]
MDQVNDALMSAKEASSVNSEWQSNPKLRRDCLFALANELEKYDHDMAQVESLQTGKPLNDSLYEVRDVIDCLRYFAGYCDKIYGQSQQLGYTHLFTIREPFGIVSLITSFNYPLLLTSWKLAPALASGNCAILKPAPQTPLSSLMLAHLATDLLPPGVFNVLPGSADVSQYLIDKTDKTSFTGSTRVGQDIMRRTADYLMPLTLECGGKNAVIVCEDADMTKAVQHIAMGAFSNAGQNCCAISRVLVEHSIYDRFLHELKENIQNSWKATLDVKKGEEDKYNLYGPLIDEQQYTNVLNSIQSYLSSPFIVGEIKSKTVTSGYFIPPTIYAHVPDNTPIAVEEIFGPVLCILKPFYSLNEAIARVNQSRYGLASAIFSKDIKKVHKAISGIKAGYVWANTYNIMPPSLPFGGRKLSGIGKDLGLSALNEFSFEKSVMMDFS